MSKQPITPWFSHSVAGDAASSPYAEGLGINLSHSAGTLVLRNELFAGLAVIGFGNGISGKVFGTVLNSGFASALLSTFEVSVIVWIALAVSINFLLRSPAQQAERRDWIAAAGFLGAILIPVSHLSWVALSGLATYILLTSRSEPSNILSRGAWILLAITVPMFWSRLLFALLSSPILEGDAALVGWIMGTHRIGNAVELSDGSGYLWIAPGCSSLANVSLAILCWVTCAKAWDRPTTLRNIGWVLGACSVVVLVNVSRISLIGFYPAHYELLHGPVGAGVASGIILCLTIGICLLGVRHDRRPAHA